MCGRLGPSISSSIPLTYSIGSPPCCPPSYLFCILIPPPFPVIPLFPVVSASFPH